MPSQAPGQDWRWRADLLLRGDFLDRPGDDLSRSMARLRVGLEWDASSWLELGAGVRGVSRDGEFVPTTDNERRDDVELDVGFLRFHLPGLAQRELTLGQAESPMRLSPMVWDEDSRASGVTYFEARDLRDFDVLELSGGWVAVETALGGRPSLGFAQVGYLLREGTPNRWRFSLAYLELTDLEELARTPLARANRVSDVGFVSDFELGDLQAEWTGEGRHGRLRVGAACVHNLGADADGTGYRLATSWRSQNRQWRLDAVAQRVQREAVLGALNSDDWWFHSAFRGSSLQIQRSLGGSWRVALRTFRERRDDLAESFDRVLVDLRWSRR